MCYWPARSCVALALVSSLPRPSQGIQCWQCAATEGRECPGQAVPARSTQHTACITWTHGNGSVLLQNVVVGERECGPDRLQFWARFVDLYYKAKYIHTEKTLSK